MPKTMLIDAAHAEETRVVVVDGPRVEEFDFESQNRKQLRGNIYLAKVTRVEPSLQAAFVEYGGNRHGFLAFSEIHPDYYQIPVADRQALLRAEAEDEEEEDEDEERGRGNRRRRRGGRSRDSGDHAIKAAEGTEAAEAFAGPTEDQPAETNEASPDGPAEDHAGEPADTASEEPAATAAADVAQDEAGEDDGNPSGGTTSIAA